VSEQTITALAGHVSKRMLERYSHIRAQAKRDAISMLESGRGWAQNWAQSMPHAPLTDSRKLDKPLDLLKYSMERVIGFEPTTLCLAIVISGISPISITALDSGKSVFLQIFLIFGVSVERYRARSIFVRGTYSFHYSPF